MKTAIILLNYGCPDSEEAVYPFLYNLFNDPAIIPLPSVLRWFLARRIASRRLFDAAENYRQIGGSPMLRIIQRQGRALATALADLGEVRAFPGMRYWHPFIHEAIQEITLWEPDQVVALPLFPHYCSATTGTVLQEVRNRSGALQARTIYIDAYYDNPDYLAAVCDTIRDALSQHRAPSDTVLLFSAHGVPQKIVDRGDPYVHQIQHCVERIYKEFPNRSVLSFQSRVGKAKWYGDFTLDRVAALGKEGVRSLAVVPISFTSENVETLYELDILVKQAALEHGIEQYIRVPAVDDRPRFIQTLADLVRIHIPS